MSGAPFGNGRSPDATNASGQRVLVTGAAGFIGSHLCDRLLDAGYQVWGLDSFDDSYDPARKRENLADVLEHPSMHLVEGDVRDRVLVDGLMADISFDAVVHLAARSGSHASIENPELTFDVNVRGTLTILEAMHRHGIPALLFASSASVYGDNSEAPFREESAADRPLSPYAASKRTGELLCHTYHQLEGLTVHCLRLSAVYGPRQPPDQLVHRLARQLADGDTGRLPEDGTATRDHAFVRDVVDGISLSLDRAENRDGKGPEYQIINLSSGESVPDHEVIDALIEQADNVPTTRQHVRGQAEDASDASVSTDRAGELLGYRPRVTFEEGMAQFARWFRRHGTVEDGSQATPGPTSEKTIG